MNINDAIQLAEQGNVNAMVAVGQAFLDNNDLDNAIRYTEMAGEAGSNNAMLTAMLLRSIVGSAAMDVNDWDGAEKHYEKAFYWASWINNMYNTTSRNEFSNEDYCTADKYALEALYNGGTCYFYQQRFRDAIDASEGLQTSKLKLLHACSLFQIVGTEQELQTVFDELKIIENSDFYKNENFSGKRDDTLVAMAAKILALLYREGLGGQPDTKKAHDILSDICTLVQTQSAKTTLSSEMSHYERTLLGGYIYR